jgi:outer membrane cobalamin receptor
MRISGKLSWQANISWIRTGIEIDPEDMEDQHTGGHHIQLYNLGVFVGDDVEQEGLIRRPNLSGFSRMNYKLSADLSLGISYRYTGKRFDATYDGSLGPYGALARLNVDGYHLVDFDGNWQITKQIGVGLKAENIFDEEYRELAGFQTRGRSVYLKLTAKW